MNKKECSKTLSGEHKWEDGSYTISGMYMADTKVKRDIVCKACGMVDDTKEEEDDTCACGGDKLPESDFCKDCI